MVNMSFNKYVEYKKEIKTQVSIESYKNKLNEELIHLSNKPDIIKLDELKKNLVDENKISKLIEKFNYPYLEELRIALKTKNAKKIEKERKKISNFAEASEVISLLLFYESFFYLNEISMKDIKKIIESYEDQTTEKLFDWAAKIDESKEKIKWHNYPTILEALYPKNGFLPNEFLLTIGDKFNKKFIINLSSNKIKAINDEDDLPSSLKEDSENLAAALLKETVKNKVANLYMAAPKKDREKIENIKKELVLGIKQFLPFNSILYEEIIEKEDDFDIWKVRTDLNKLKKINDKYIALEEDVPLKWIKKI